ncbi:hypothetical protein D3C78_1509910 [compost metagenome]
MRARHQRPGVVTAQADELARVLIVIDQAFQKRMQVHARGRFNFAVRAARVIDTFAHQPFHFVQVLRQLVAVV